MSTRRTAPEPSSGSAGPPPQDSPDVPWVESFLLSQPGKTYRTEVADDAHEAATREALAAAAHALTDDVLRAAGEHPDEFDGR